MRTRSLPSEPSLADSTVRPVAPAGGNCATVAAPAFRGLALCARALWTRRSGYARAAGVPSPSRFVAPVIVVTRTARSRVGSRADGRPRGRHAAVINGVRRAGLTIVTTNAPFARVAA